MIKVKAAAIAAACVFAPSCASTLAPLVAPQVNTEASALRDGAYQLDHDHAALIFRVDHLGFSDFIGRFESFDATLDFDPDDPQAARIDAIIDVASLDIANDAFADTLISGQWLDADKFPQARFVSTGMEITGPSSGIVTGAFTLHGVTAPMQLAVTFNGGARDRLRGGAYVVGFSATGGFDRTVFGVDRFSGVVGDRVSIEIEAEFIRRNAD